MMATKLENVYTIAEFSSLIYQTPRKKENSYFFLMVGYIIPKYF